ncbi:MAG TPA: 30S ribosome-binding factor RbfA [Phycisphaerales bacterium]|nr:30S ribosome-binding factor RbfA [Phycisphaerales bacterium]HCD32483.1 30S ribosome-binding factor RbfA [Phycisphaerales bacterium]|tara:strand:+ start:2539 stop:2946 length:408 start_codon:yes stop_codon:yes gene_type:complete
MTHRKEQFESTLKRAISTMLQRDLSDPRIRGMVSVTHVAVTKDMREATIKVSVIPAEYEKLTLHGLNSAAKHIHGKLFKQMDVRRLPFLKFVLDPTLKKQAEVYAAIQEGLAKEKALEDDADTVNSEEDTQEPTS